MLGELNVDLIINWIWGIVQIGMCIGAGLWVLSFFLPVGEFFNGVAHLFRKKRVLVRCPKCSHKNDEISQFCSECGTKL